MELLGAEGASAAVRCWEETWSQENMRLTSLVSQKGYFADFTCCSQLFFEYLSKILAGQFSFDLYISILRKLSFVSAPDPSLEKDRGKSGCGPA